MNTIMPCRAGEPPSKQLEVGPQVVMCPEKSHPQENKEKALLGYTQAVDAWALGVLVYELIVGHPPFERETRTDTYEQIMYRRPHYPANLSEAPRSFISAALTKVRSSVHIVQWNRPTLGPRCLGHGRVKSSRLGDACVWFLRPCKLSLPGRPCRSPACSADMHCNGRTGRLAAVSVTGSFKQRVAIGIPSRHPCSCCCTCKCNPHWCGVQSARKRPSVEELLGHPWVAMPRGPSLQPAVSDGASQQAVQLPPPQLGALATQALKNYASLKEVIRQLMQPQQALLVMTPAL